MSDFGKAVLANVFENVCLAAVTVFLFWTNHPTAGAWALVGLIVNVAGTTLRYPGGASSRSSTS